jgi:hypothetical protein
MFNRKSKPKLDAKTRFQHTQFTKKLEEQKHYKRTLRQVPDGRGARFFAGLGLQSWWSRIGIVLGIGLLVYIVWIPNPLFVQSVVVQGVSGQLQSQIEVDAQEYLNSGATGVPQKNMLFLNTEDLQHYLIKDNPLLLRVVSIEKKFFGKVVITAIAKTERYVVGTEKGVYVLYNDASFSREFSDDASRFAAALPGLVKVRINAPIVLSAVGPSIDLKNLKAIEIIQQRFEEKTKNSIDYFEIPVAINGLTVTPSVETTTTTESLLPAEEPKDLVINQQEVVVIARRPAGNSRPTFKVVLDTAGDVPDLLDRLGILFANMAPERYQTLSYVDLRFKERAFICLVNTPCVQALTPLPSPSAEVVDPVKPINEQAHEEPKAE